MDLPQYRSPRQMEEKMMHSKGWDCERNYISKAPTSLEYPTRNCLKGPMQNSVENWRIKNLEDFQQD